jgi:hypothetical protein
VGSDPEAKMKISGTQQFELLKEELRSNGGGSIYSFPKLSVIGHNTQYNEPKPKPQPQQQQQPLILIIIVNVVVIVVTLTNTTTTKTTTSFTFLSM